MCEHKTSLFRDQNNDLKKTIDWSDRLSIDV